MRRAGLGVYALGAEAERRAAIGELIRALKHRPLQQRTKLAEEVALRSESELPDGLMMTSEQVRMLRREGFEIGAHTVNHPILAQIGMEEARNEIDEGRRQLETLVGEPVTIFAYPNGRPVSDYQDAHVRLVEELKFDAAVSTIWGRATMLSDKFQLPRISPWDQVAWRFLARVLTA